jgi:hypothetical protein
VITSLFPSLLLGCAALSGSSPEKDAGVPGAHGNHGYALLFDLMGDEANVSKLRLIKHERQELKELIKQISNTCGGLHTQMETFGKQDPGLNLKDQGLPPAEVEARKAISQTKTKLLLTDKNKEFELQLLLTQNEALTYGAHLARVVSRVEANPQRAQFLQHMDSELTTLQQKVVAMLLANYVWRETK